MRTSIPLLTTLLLSSCATHPPHPPSRPFAPRLPDAPGLSNVARITTSLYRGAQPDSEGYRTLKKMGVKTVISCRNFNPSERAATTAGLRYLASRG